MTDTPSAPASAPALRPLTQLVGRGGEMGRLLGHLDAHRSVRLQAARGAGATALLRALCAEPPRPGAPDGTLALPAGIPPADLAEVAARLLPAASTPAHDRALLLLLDDRDATAADVALLRETFPHSLIVITGGLDADEAGLVPVTVAGLSQHHAVGMVEAAMGRALSIDEGRSARRVATAVEGLPGPLVQAAAAVRDAGLSFDDVLDVLDDPPRTGSLAVALQHALDDDLHVTLSHLRALGDVPVTTSLAAAAAGVEVDVAARRLRRLAYLGLVLTDGRDGWTVAAGIPTVSEPVRAGAADRVAEWLEVSHGCTLFDVAGVLSAVADRMQSGDRAAALRLTQAALGGLPLNGMDATQVLLERAATWSMPEPGPAVAQPAEPLLDDAGPDADSDHAVRDAAANEAGPGTAPEPAEPVVDVDEPPTTAPDAQRYDATDEPGGEPAAEQNPVLALIGDRRRLAMIAVVAAAVIAAMLLVVPSLRDDESPPVVRSEVDLGVASLGESTSGTLTIDLTGNDAALPVALVLEGPDSESFAVEPARCDTADCRASLTFTPDRAGTHVATVRAVDSQDVAQAVAELTGSGTGDPPEVPVSTNLAVTLFPVSPDPLPAGGEGVLPIGVRNNGPDDSTGARLVVTVPPRVTAEATGCTFEEAVLSCPLAELAAGTQERVAVTLTLPPRIQQVRVIAEVSPLTDTDDAGGDNAAGFTYPVGPAQ